ncbi:uncharacterized protein PAC_19818 [Phialocephala subalpina]|uniref:Uncharacterized protein n=1 Tax=Phialocephala subalpina TaxID=576137 RepID=A0A1L7XY19_9HELO|nr:uncharacterized protein PAC_19818 [Phialocephala subalpina]
MAARPLGVGDILQGPILEGILSNVNAQDTLNLAQAGTAPRRAIQGRLGDDLTRYRYGVANSEPPNSRCNCQNWGVLPPAAAVGPHSWIFKRLLFCSLPQPTIVAHMNQRIVDHGLNPATVGPVVPTPAAPYYPFDQNDWYPCARAFHANPNDRACKFCTEDKEAFITHQLKHRSWMPLCGKCHRHATRNYPHGYNSCKCLVKMSNNTCVVCCDWILGRWERRVRNKRQHWDFGQATQSRGPAGRNLRVRREPRGGRARQETQSRMPKCPCGEDIDAVKHPNAYPRPRVEVHSGVQNGILGLGLNILALRSDWSKFCLECDGLVAPATAPGPKQNPLDTEEQLPFRRAMGMREGHDLVEDEWRRVGRQYLE